MHTGGNCADIEADHFVARVAVHRISGPIDVDELAGLCVNYEDSVIDRAEHGPEALFACAHGFFRHLTIGYVAEKPNSSQVLSCRASQRLGVAFDEPLVVSLYFVVDALVGM